MSTDYITLTPALAKIARETLADVATPAGSLGVVSRVRNRKGTVSIDVANPLADDYGTHEYPMDRITVSPDTVAYWQRQGYVD